MHQKRNTQYRHIFFCFVIVVIFATSNLNALAAKKTDFNDDGCTNSADVLDFKQNFRSNNPRFDINDDNNVNVDDLSYVMIDFSSDCEPQAAACNTNGICNANETESSCPSDCGYEVSGKEFCDGIDNDEPGTAGYGLVDEAQGFDKGFCDTTTLRPLPKDSSTSLFTEEELLAAFDDYYFGDPSGSLYSKPDLIELSTHVPADDADGSGQCTDYQYVLQFGMTPLVRIFELTGDEKYLTELEALANNLLSPSMVTDFGEGPPGWDATGCRVDLVTDPYRWQIQELQGLRPLTELASILHKKGLKPELVNKIVNHVEPILDYYSTPNQNGYIQLDNSFDKNTHFMLNALRIQEIVGNDSVDYIQRIKTIHNFPNSGIYYEYDDSNFLYPEWYESKKSDRVDVGHGNRWPEFVSMMSDSPDIDLYDEDDIRRTLNVLLFKIWVSDPNVTLVDPTGVALDDTPYPNLYWYWLDGNESDCMPGNRSAYNGIVSRGWNYLGRYDGRAWWLMQQMTDAVIHRTLIKRFPAVGGCLDMPNQNNNVVTGHIVEALAQLRIIENQE